MTVLKKEKVLEAIDKAKGFGKGRYIDDDETCCVVAKIFECNGLDYQMLDLHQLEPIWDIETDQISQEEKYFLEELQMVWDKKHYDTDMKIIKDPVRAKEVMREITEEFFGG